MQRGTDEQYIDIFDNFGIQLFGFDFYEKTVVLNEKLFDSMNEEEREKILADIKADADFKESYLYYSHEHGTDEILFKTAPDLGAGVGG